MKIYYDREVDALYIELRKVASGTADNRELTEDIIADYGIDGKLAGIEILDASQVLGKEALEEIIFEDTSVGLLRRLTLV